MGIRGVRAGMRRWSTTSPSALACYLALAFVFFGLRLMLAPGPHYLGTDVDPQLFIWSFAWWPHAILHGENPFYTHVVWAPAGLNLAWTTAVPGLALLFAPVTLLFGAIVSYDLAAVLMPALAAWTAFLLCRHLTRRFWPSLAGGYLFGFSSYLLGQETGHLNMTSVFLVPLVALVVVRYVEGELDAPRLVVRLVPLFALQVLFSTEIAFTLALALGTSIVVGVALIPERRHRIVALVLPLGAAGLLAAVLVSPYLYYEATGYSSSSVNSPAQYIADLLNFVVPTKLALASLGWAGSISRRFPGNDGERGAYLGIPALAIVALYAWRGARRPEGRFLLAGIFLAALASLGQVLTVGGHQVISLPWRLVEDRAVFDNVLPTRLTMFVALGVAVVVALWAAAERAGPARWALTGLALLAVAPNPVATHAWTMPYRVPPFFTGAAYKGCLAAGEIVFVLPAVHDTDLSLWQVESGFRFRTITGNISKITPSRFQASPIGNRIRKGLVVAPGQASELLSFLRTRGVTSVIVEPSDVSRWQSTLDRIASPERTGGVVVYRLGGRHEKEPGGACG